MSELISVVIPVYKVEQYIKECVTSAINQTHDNIEIILVDDCGGDRSIEIAEELLKQSSRKWKIIRHNKNKGQGAARNTGTEAVEGEYFYYLDSDDYIAPETLSILYRAIKKYDADMAFGQGYQVLLPDGTFDIIKKDTAANLHESDPYHAFLRSDTNSGPCHRLVRTKSYLKTGIKFPEDVALEDFIWSFHLAKSGLTICTAEGKNLYFYRKWEGSTTAQYEGSGKLWKGSMVLADLFYESLVSDSLFNDKDFCWRYEELFNRLIYIIMTRLNSSRRQRCQQMEAFLHRFPQCTPGLSKIYRIMRLYVSLAKFMPAIFAYKIAKLWSKVFY